MKQEIKEKIEGFLNNLDFRNYITEYIEVEDIDLDNAYQWLYDELEESAFFNVDIIYYSNAIDFLKENDPSLHDSLELAGDLGYDTENLSSEILASLLASDMELKKFHDLKNEIEEFFDEIREEVEELEDEDE